MSLSQPGGVSQQGVTPAEVPVSQAARGGGVPRPDRGQRQDEVLVALVWSLPALPAPRGHPLLSESPLSHFGILHVNAPSPRMAHWVPALPRIPIKAESGLKTILTFSPSSGHFFFYCLYSAFPVPQRLIQLVLGDSCSFSQSAPLLIQRFASIKDLILSAKIYC